MEMFALIEKGNDVKIVKSSDIEKKANILAKDFIGNFLDDIIVSHGKDYAITLDDLDLFQKEDEFGEYVINDIMSKIIVKKRKNEINRLLKDLFNYYDLDSSLVYDILRYSSIDKVFYNDMDGSIFYDKRFAESAFNGYFGFLTSEDLIKRLDLMIESSEYSLNYRAEELKNYVLENDNIIKADRKNFEYLLYLFDEIPNPRVSPSSRHMCYSCSNLSPVLCKKAEYYKKRIDSYSFINQGYQVFITTNYKDLNMTSFIVEDCNDYKFNNDTSLDESEYKFVKKMHK